MDEDFLDVLLDATAETRLKLVTADEARAIVVLLGVLEDADCSPDQRLAAREMRLRLGSRLSPPQAPPAPRAL
ncbi:hypothetical protein ACIRBY_37450 [Streptomyces sp. NPDC096136]|uniref:hypothetical protein n=1 Tax=Streptomyces sp. NPDC096136 TaxID=3366076 RepID=UPI003819530C